MLCYVMFRLYNKGLLPGWPGYSPLVGAQKVGDLSKSKNICSGIL